MKNRTESARGWIHYQKISEVTSHGGRVWVLALLTIIWLGACVGEDYSEPARAFVETCIWAETRQDRWFEIGNHLSHKIVNDLYRQASGDATISTSDINSLLLRSIADHFHSRTLRLKSGSRRGDTAVLVYTQPWKEEARILMEKEDGRWKIRGWRIGTSGMGIDPDEQSLRGK